jgi:hypothetical protein
MRQVVRPGVSNADLKEMLFDLAGYTLCRRYHQNQATDISDRWFGLVQRHCGNEDDRGSDTSDDDDDDDDDDGDSDDGTSSTGSSSDDSGDDDNDNAPRRRVAENAQELRRRFDELETLQHEFEELLQRQRRSLQDRMSRSTLASQRRPSRENRRAGSDLSRHSTNRERESQVEIIRTAEQARHEADYTAAQPAIEAAHEQCCRDRAEQARREEAQQQAQAQREAEAKANAEAERLREEQKAERLCEEEEEERARLDRERQTKEQRAQNQSRILSWKTAWAELTPDSNSTPVDTDVRTSEIWPTKSGSFVSCCEDVRAFFRYQPGAVNRRILGMQALRWHQDRAARLFACVADELMVGEVMRTVTMISRVVVRIIGVAAQ